MGHSPRKFSVSATAVVLVLGVSLAGCSTRTPSLGLRSSGGVYAANGKTSGREYFSASALGVSASPRVGRGPRLPRGGGYQIIGKPYTVNGRTYVPTASPKDAEIGLASWYGAAFHGRLTANGEVYDMARLTAAHKTFPLPSYARVTNMENGRSLIVRVNDRGPFVDDRVIDLSKGAADILDYTHGGTAKVKVEYAGPAPLNGNDDAFLMASIRGGPGDRFGQPASNVMVAMNGPTPRGNLTSAVAGRIASGTALIASAIGRQPRTPMPQRVPLPSERPVPEVGVSAYASMRVANAFSDNPFAHISTSDWKSR